MACARTFQASGGSSRSWPCRNNPFAVKSRSATSAPGGSLVTHFAVECESAKELTTSTFAHYAANPTAPKAESLHQAMLKVMGMPQFSHPAFWAPYALVGDGGR